MFPRGNINVSGLVWRSGAKFRHVLPGYIDGSGLGKWRNQLTTLAVCTPVPMLTWIFLAPCSIMILVNLWGFFLGCEICQLCGVVKSSSKTLTKRQPQWHHMHGYTWCLFLTGTPLKMSLDWHPPNLLGLAVSLKCWNRIHFARHLDVFDNGGWLLKG